MEDFFKITCPGCQTIIVIRRKDGEVVEVRKPILEESTGDRFEDAMKKVRESPDSVTRKVEEAREREKTKMDRINSLFDDSLKRAKDEGDVSRPVNPLDLD